MSEHVLAACILPKNHSNHFHIIKKFGESHNYSISKMYMFRKLKKKYLPYLNRHEIQIISIS